MVGSTGTLMSMRLVRSKLRKREESSSMPPATTLEAPPLPGSFGKNRSNSAPNTSDRHRQEQQVVLAASSLSESNVTSRMSTANHSDCSSKSKSSNYVEQEHVTFTRTSGVGAATAAVANSWVFPPKAPTPNIYSYLNNDALVAENDKNGFRGFRKQFSGRFKRLVAKKPELTPAIPPELKPQLKTIYVY